MILEIVCIYKKDDKQVYVDIKKNGILYQKLKVSEVIEFINNIDNVNCTNFSIVDSSYFRGRNCKLRMEVLDYEQVRLDVRKLYESDRKGYRRVESGTTRKKEKWNSQYSGERRRDSESDRACKRGCKTKSISSTSNDVCDDIIKYDKDNIALLNNCTAKDFKKNFDKAHKSIPFSPCVDKHSEAELSNMCCLYTRGVGFVAVSKDGNICSVLKDEGSKVRGFAKISIVNALRHNGDKLDCFALDRAGNLVDMYMRCGFIPICRVKFNPEYAPEDWKSEWGTPDVVFMAHNLDTADEVVKKYGTYSSYQQYLKDNGEDSVPYFEDYDEAFAYRDKVLQDMRNKKYSKSLKGGFNIFKDALSKTK